MKTMFSKDLLFSRLSEFVDGFIFLPWKESFQVSSFHAVLQEVLMRVVRSEGFFSLWKGFTPYYARLGPHTVLTFIFLEQMNRLYKTYVLDR